MLERAGLSRPTNGKIEKGDPSAAMGSYGAVLFVLVMKKRLSNLVYVLPKLVGRKLENENLPQRVRIPHSEQGANHKCQRNMVWASLGITSFA